jgi:nitrous oxidase accessory protein NosD
LTKTLLLAETAHFKQGKCMGKSVVLLLALVFLIAIGVPNAQPTKAVSRNFIVTNVDQLMNAINDAANGDVISVKSGTYDTPQDQTVRITKSISLVGEDASSTVINLHPAWAFQGGWNGVTPVYGFNDALEIKASDVEISGLTFSSEGGSIRATGSGILIRNSKIETYLSASGRYQNISQNTITGGIGCWGSFNSIAGNRIVGSGVDVPGFANMIYDNVVADGEGITLIGYNEPYAANEENIFLNNTVKDCSFGLRVWLGGWQPDGIVYHNYSSQNIVYHNNFIGNDRQVSFYQYNRSWIIEYSGFLDNGKEGNYWSDYAGNDENGDGIGDSPYVINANNRDRYPLIYPWGAPDVSVYSLQNVTYSGAIPLNFTVNKPTSWTGYSLDGLDNVTITENTTLTGISSGFHNITVYALDMFGVSGASETVHFSIAKEQEFFPITPVAVAAVVIALVVGVGLLVYFKKRKH